MYLLGKKITHGEELKLDRMESKDYTKGGSK